MKYALVRMCVANQNRVDVRHAGNFDTLRAALHEAQWDAELLDYSGIYWKRVDAGEFLGVPFEEDGGPSLIFSYGISS